MLILLGEKPKTAIFAIFYSKNRHKSIIFQNSEFQILFCNPLIERALYLPRIECRNCKLELKWKASGVFSLNNFKNFMVFALECFAGVF